MSTHASQEIGSNLISERFAGITGGIAGFFEHLTPYGHNASARRELAGKKLQESMARARSQKLKALSNPAVPNAGFLDLLHLYDVKDRVLIFPLPPQGHVSKSAVRQWSEACARSIPTDFPHGWGVGSVAIRSIVGDPTNIHPQSRELIEKLAKESVKLGVDAEPDDAGIVRLPRFGTDSPGKIKRWTLGVIGAGDNEGLAPLGQRSLIVGVDPLTYAILVAKNASNRFGHTTEVDRQIDLSSSLLLSEVKLDQGLPVPLYSYGKIK